MAFRDQFSSAGDRCMLGGQINLGLFDRQHELLLVGRIQNVVASLELEAIGQHLGQQDVHVVAAQLADALAADLLKDAVMDAQDGDIERAAAEVIDQDGLLFLGVEAVADGRGRRFVDQRQHLQSGSPGAELGRMARQPFRVGRHGHDRLLDRFVEPLFGVLLEQAEEHHGDLLGPEVLADERDALRGAKDSLDGANGALFVERLLGLLPEGERAVAAERDHGRRPLEAFFIGDDLGLAVLKIGNDRVARSEVDSYVGHGKSSTMEPRI